MIRLVYVSSAVSPLSDQKLADLLRISQANNERSGLTGMLLYRGGNFIQVLEGEEPVLRALYKKIEVDPRHRGLIKLVDETCAQRDFAGWSMAFQNLDQIKVANVPGYSDFFDWSLDDPRFQAHPSKTLEMLRSFKRTMR